MKRRLLGRVFSAFLCLTLAFCLGFAFRTSACAIAEVDMEASATNFQYYPSGCLKSVDISARTTSSSYATAYGRYAIHKGMTSFDYYHPYISGSANWPSDTSRDATFLAFGDSADFTWTDGNWHNATIHFSDGQIPVNSSNTYYIILWSKCSYGVYPDKIIGTLNSNGEKVVFNNSGSTPGNELLPSEARHTHHWVVTGDNTDTLTATCTGTVGTCDKQSVSAKISASSVTLPDSPYNAVVSGAEGFQTQTGLKLQPLADKGRAAYKFKARGADQFTDPDLQKAEAGTYQAIVYVTDDDGVTHSAFVEYTAIDPVQTAATGDNRPIELMVLGLGMFCAMAAACFTLDRKSR